MSKKKGVIVRKNSKKEESSKITQKSLQDLQNALNAGKSAEVPKEYKHKTLGSSNDSDAVSKEYVDGKEFKKQTEDESYKYSDGLPVEFPIHMGHRYSGKPPETMDFLFKSWIDYTKDNCYRLMKDGKPVIKDTNYMGTEFFGFTSDHLLKAKHHFIDKDCQIVATFIGNGEEIDDQGYYWEFVGHMSQSIEKPKEESLKLDGQDSKPISLSTLQLHDAYLPLNHLFSQASKKAFENEVKELNPKRPDPFGLGQIIDILVRIEAIAPGERKIFDAAKTVANLINGLADRKYITGAMTKLAIVQLYTEPFCLPEYAVFSFVSLKSESIEEIKKRMQVTEENGMLLIRPDMRW
jgi:hypothetical protein